MKPRASCGATEGPPRGYWPFFCGMFDRRTTPVERASETIPASATTVTSGNRWAATNASMAGRVRAPESGTVLTAVRHP